MARGAVAVVGLVYLFTRLGLVALPPVGLSDAHFASLATQWELAGRDGATFYANRSAESEARDVEYPPLFLWLVRVPHLVAPDEPFHVVFQRLMIVTDAVALVVGVWLTQWLFAGGAAGRVAVYSVATLALFPVLLTTADLIVGLVLLIALGLLTSGRLVWSLTLLALGVGLKVTPIAAAPVWLIGTLPAWNAGRVLVRRAVVFGVLCAQTVVPFVLLDGLGAVGFVRYRAARGIHYESVAGTLLWAVDSPVEEYGAYGCTEVRSPHSAAVARAIPWVAAAGWAAVTVLFLRAVRRSNAGEDGTLAARRPHLFAGFALLFVMAFIVTNKVYLAAVPAVGGAAVAAGSAGGVAVAGVHGRAVAGVLTDDVAGRAVRVAGRPADPVETAFAGGPQRAVRRADTVSGGVAGATRNPSVACDGGLMV